MEVQRGRKRTLSTDQTQNTEKPVINKKKTKQSAPSKARIGNKGLEVEKDELSASPVSDHEYDESDHDDTHKKGKSAKEKLERGKKKTAKGKRSISEGTRKEAPKKGKKKAEKKEKEESEDEEAEQDDNEGEMEIEEEQEEKKETAKLSKAEKEMEVEHEDSDEECHVCYSKVSETFRNSEMGHLYEMMQCKNCEKSVHLICYGLETATEQEEGLKYFLCDSCTHSAQNSSCYICGDSQGFLRYTTDNKWVHILCGIGNHNVHFESVTNMQIDLSAFKKESQKLKAFRKCKECKNKVGTLHLEGENEEYCHLNCALRSRAQWTVEFKMQQEAGFSVYNEVDEELLLAHIEEVASNLKDIAKECDLDEVKEEKKALNDLQKKKASKTAKAKKKADKEEMLLQSVLEETKARVKQNFGEAMLEEKNEEDVKSMGGKVVLRHLEVAESQDKESTQPSKAKGKKKAKKQDENEETKKPEINVELQRTLIAFNREIQKENNTILDIQACSGSNIIKLRSNLPVFPTLETLSFPEMMFFVIVLQNRLNAAAANLSSLDDLKNLINSAKMLPFPLERLLRAANQKYYLATAVDVLLETWIATCAPKSAFNGELKHFDETIMARNTQVIELFEDLQKLYLEKPCLTMTPQFEAGKKSHEKALFLKKFADQMSKFFGKTETQSSTHLKVPKKGSQAPYNGPVTPVKDLPPVPIAIPLELAAEAKKLGLNNEEFEEMKLLGKLNSGSKNLLDINASGQSNRSRGTNISKSEKNSVRKLSGSEERNAKEQVGKLSLGKATIRSPLKMAFETQKRGKPQKFETMQNEIEKVYDTELEKLNAKQGFKDAEKRLKKLTKSHKEEDKEEIEELEAKIRRVSEWKEAFVKAEKQKEDLSALLDEIDELDLRTNEMLRALDHKRKWRLWRASVKLIEIKLNKKKGDTETGDAVTIEQLGDAVKEGTKLENVAKDDGKLAGLKEKLELVKKIQEKMKDESYTLEDLEAMDRELKHVNVKFPELATLHTKLKMNRELETLLKETISLEDLEEKYEVMSKESGIDLGRLMELKSKVTEGKNKKNMAERFLSVGMNFELGETSEMAQLVNGMKAIKVVIPEIVEIERMLDKAVALWKVYVCLFGGEIPDRNSLQAGQCMKTSEKTLQNIQAECDEAFKKGGHIEVPEKRFDIMKNLCKIMLVEDGVLNGESDEKIKLFFEQLNMAIATDTIRKVEVIEPHEIADFSKTFFEETMAELALKLAEDNVEYDEITEKVRNLLERFDTLKTKLESRTMSSEEDTTTVKKMIDCCEWTNEVCKKKKAIEEGSEFLTAGKLQVMVQKMRDLGISTEIGIGMELAELHQRVDLVITEYEREYASKRKEALMRKESTITLETARKIHEQLKSVNGSVSFEREIKQVEEDIATLTKCEEKLETKIDQYLDMVIAQSEKIATPHNRVLSSQEESDAKAEIEKLRKEASQGVIKSERYDELFKRSKWLFNVKEMTKKFNGGLVEEDRLENLCREGKRLLDNHQADEKAQVLVTFLNKELTLAENVKRCVEKLKKIERTTENKEQMALTSFQEAISQMNECKVELEDERKYLKQMGERSRTLKEKAIELVEEGKKQKKPFASFVKMLETLDKFPVCLEEKILVSDLSTERNYLSTFAQKGAIKDFETLVNVSERYQELPIVIEKLEEALKPLEGAITDYKDVKAKAEEMRESKLSLEALEGLEKKVEDLEKSLKDPWLQQLQSEIVTRRAEFIKETEEEEQTKEATVGEEKVKDCVDFLGKLVKEVAGEEKEDESVAEPEVELDEAVDNYDFGVQDMGEQYFFEEDGEEKQSKSKGERTDNNGEEKTSRKESTNKETIPANTISSDELNDTIMNILSSKDPEEIAIEKKSVQSKAETLKDKHPCVKAVRRMLESCKNLELTDEQSLKFSKSLIGAFPEIVRSKEAFEKVVLKIRTIIRHPSIGKRMLKKEFDGEYLKRLYNKDEKELKAEAAKLKQKNWLNYSENPDNEFASPVRLQKRVKQDSDDIVLVKGRGSAQGSATSTPNKIVRENSNALASFNIEKMQKTDSGKRNMLKKVLQGERAIDLAKEDDENSKDLFGDYQLVGEFDSGDMNDEPVSEKLSARRLEPTSGHSKSENAPVILYDPDNPNAVVTQRPREDSREKRKSSKPHVEISSDSNRYIPRGTILKIFDGILKPGEDSKCPKCAFFTCNDFNVVNTIPQLTRDGHATFKMAGKLSQSKFEAYLNKAFNCGSKEEKVIGGWIESHVSIYEDALNQFSKQLIESRKIGVCPYNESAKVFLLHKQQMHPNWKQKLNFQTKKVQMTSNPSLYFIIIYKPYKLKASTKSIAPEIVPSLDSSNTTTNLELKSLEGFGIRRRSDSIEENPGLLPYEPDFGAEITHDSGDLWGQNTATENTPPKSRNVPQNNKAAEFSLNGKRDWEELSNEKNERKPRSGFMGDPKKKFMNERRGFQQETKPLRKGDPTVEDIAKMKREELVMALESMEQEKIIELAKEMDQTTRESVIEVLREINEKEKEQEQELVYRPPYYIQRMYNMFTPEQMQRAKNQTENRRNSYGRENKPKNNHNNSFKRNHNEYQKPIGQVINLSEGTNNMNEDSAFSRTYMFSDRTAGFNNNGARNQNNNTVTEQVSAIAKQLLDGFAASGNAITIPKSIYTEISQTQVKAGRNPLINKYLGNKENSTEPVQKRNNMGNNQMSYNRNGMGSRFNN